MYFDTKVCIITLIELTISRKDDSNMKHGFIKVATATPHVTVADCRANLNEILKIWKDADQAGVKLLVYPELSLTGATCGDLFHSESMILSA